MGSLCGTNTTTQRSTSTPTGFPLLADIYNRVSSVASQPYTPYGGQMVAGLTPTQQSGISGVTNAQGAAQPYFDQAAQYAQNGAASIDPSSIQKYMSPYTQNVIDATKANFQQDNAIGQQQVVGNAAMKGALGGDRVGVAQAELARQQGLAQNPVIAGLENQNYSQALSAAEQDRAAQAQGAYTFGALAPSVQNAQISGAQAQIGAGGLEQQTNQAGLSAAYNQYLQQLAFPYQQAGFLASAGLPAVNAMGGSSTGQTTGPAPSPWGQVAGLGLTAASFLKDGGRVGYAGGGPVGLFDIPTYVPKYSGAASMSPYAVAPAPTPQKQQPMPMFSPQALSGAKGGLQRFFGDDGASDAMAQIGPTYAGDGIGAMGGVSFPIFRSGGRVTDKHAKFHATVNAIRQTIRGGAPSRGYASGGDVSGSRFDDAFSPFAIPPDNTQANRELATAMADKYLPEGSIELNAGAPMPRPRPFEAPGIAAGSVHDDGGLPPTQTANAGLPADAMAYGTSPASPYASMPPSGSPMAPTTPNTPATPTASTKGLFGNPFGLTDEGRQGLLAAGLGTLASRSPFALSAIGEGGLQGVKTYSDQKAQKQKVDAEARKLTQQAEQFAQNLGLHRDQFAEAQRQHNMAEQTKLVPPGMRWNADRTAQEPIPGGLQDPATILAQSNAKRGTTGLLGGDTIQDMAGQYLAGDPSVLTNLGRGAQGAENIVKLRTEIARQAREAGMTPAQVAVKMAEFKGFAAGQRTLGTQEAKMGTAAFEAEGAIKLARDIITKVPRTGFLPFNQLIQGYQNKTLNPDQAELFTRTQGVVNAYAAVMARGANVTTDASRHRAEELLNTASNPEVYNRVMDTMLSEIEMAKNAPHRMREFYRKQYGEKSTDGSAATPAAAATTGATAPQGTTTPQRVRQNGHTYELQSDGKYKAVD